MSASRYPDNNNRYGRDRSPPYRDRRPSNFGGVYPPRGNESNRANLEPSTFPPRETPRGPKSLADTPRGPAPAPLANAPSGRGRGFPGRGEPTPLREAPPLSSGTLPSLNTHNSWRADRPDRDHRDREFDRRERRPSPPRRSPIRDSRDPRDQREFLPRDLDVNRARRNSRDGALSAGSTFSDPPLGVGSSYRGSGIGRGRGGSHFGGRGRNFHSDDRDRHHEVRDRIPDRSYRPRSRSPPIRRERDPRDERDFDRRDRDDRRFVPREYDSYIGPAGAAKPGLRALDTHRGSGPSDLRHLPGTPTGPTPHASHHASPADRLGPQADSYPRRTSIAIDPSSAKDSRRDPGKDDLLLASRAEASRERYAPRASSPPASIPAFGGSNVWRNPNTTLESKPPTIVAPPPPPPQPPQPPKPVQTAPAAPAAPVTSAPPTIAPVNAAVTIPTAPKATIPTVLPTVPPTGPKADRIPDRPSSDRPIGDMSYPGSRPAASGPPRMELPPNPPPFVSPPTTLPTAADVPVPDKTVPKAPALHSAPRHPQAQSLAPSPSSNFAAPSGPSAPSAPSTLAKSPPLGPALKPRVPPLAPQAVLRANVSPSFPRNPHPPFVARDASPSAMPPALGPRNSSVGAASSIHTSPKSLPSNIPTGPKADRAPVAPRPPPMYPPLDRPNFTAPRAPMGERPKSMQWLRPGLVPNRNTVPSKREFPYEDRERTFGSAPKAPRLESSVSASQVQHTQHAKSESPTLSRVSAESEKLRGRAASAERHMAPTPNPTSVEMRRHSDVFMADASPRPIQPPASAASSVPEVLQDSDDDLDLDEDDFAESETKYNRERSLLEGRRVDLSAPHLRATTPLQEIMLLACLTAEHIPQEGPEPHHGQKQSVAGTQKTAPLSPGQPQPEKEAAELPTPKAEESYEEDVMEVKDERRNKEAKGERSVAPATVALRLRREPSVETEDMPDMSALPYLGSGPPTPLSDIEQDRPQISDTVLLAVRDKLRQTLEPELNTEETLRQYAEVYKQWRLTIHPWDEEREQDEQERQPSAEPGLKATTPDVQSAAMAGILDAQSAPTGRRGHSSRWATELDIEQVIKESLKTAEEERMGKREQEPKRSMADPEREASLPRELTGSEARRRRFIDTNFQREPGSGIFAFHYEPPEDDFTPEEHRVMVHNYKDQYAKKWGKLAEILYKEVGTERTYKDCINHYYATKWGKEYKGKLKGRRGGARKRGGATGRGRGAIANMDRSEVPGEDGLPLALTESGRPKRSAAPTFGGMEIEFDTSATVHVPGRPRRPTDADETQEKASRRSKVKEKGGRKAKNLLPAAVPAGSPVKIDRKEKGFGVKMEDEYGKRPLEEMPMPMHAGFIEDQMILPGDSLALSGFVPAMVERPKTQATARPGPSSYWSVSELQDFDKYVEHFGTDWLAIANHMGTKTHTMIKNQYLRHVESGKAELEQKAQEADRKRERGDNLGPPPMPTPAPKRRYESTQAPLPRNLAPTPELHNSPLSNPLSLPKLSPPHSTPSSRFSTIAQAPISSKATIPAHGNHPLADASLSSMSPMAQQQSPPPPPPPPRSQPQHRHQHTLSQHKPHHPGPARGYFSDDVPPRMEGRPPSQSSSINTSQRPLQHHIQTQSRSQEQHQPPLFRTMSHQDRENRVRSELQQEQEARQRYQQQQQQQQQHHARRISQEMHHHHRPFPPGGPTPLMPPVRSNSNVGSPEHRPLSYSHSRHTSQSQDMISQVHGGQQFPLRSAIPTPTAKEEQRHPPASAPSQVQSTPLLPSQHQLHPQFGQAPVQHTPPPPAPKPAAEARKSNLMSLLNDPEPEEPRRKKPGDQGTSSHSSTPQQQMPIAPPPPAPQSLPSRRDPYNEPITTQPPYSRPSYAQQSPLPTAGSNRLVDITNDQTSGARPGMRENWQQRQQFLPSQSQAQQQTPASSSHPGLPQPHFSDPRSFANHRAVFAQHNAPRHNPSPPPLSAYNNSPHLHSRTPSVSGPPMQPSRHGLTSTNAAQHPQGTPGSTSQILQPNPYAQVDPPGSSAPPSGPMGMRPSPHLHTTHLAQQREISSRNEHSQAQNANISYSNPQTPKEIPAKPMRVLSSMAESYRPRDLREALHDYDPRNSDRDTSRELSQKADFLREQISNPQLRSNVAPPMQEELRYQPQQQDRGMFAQRSHTPLSRSEHGQPPPLQHPPHSSLGANNHAIYGQRPSEEPSHRFSQSLHRDRSIADRIREEQQQQHREEYMRREEMRERDMRERERETHFRDSMIRRDARGPPAPGLGMGPGPDTRPPAGSMDWSNPTRHPQDRWQR